MLPHSTANSSPRHYIEVDEDNNVVDWFSHKPAVKRYQLKKRIKQVNELKVMPDWSIVYKEGQKFPVDTEGSPVVIPNWFQVPGSNWSYSRVKHKCGGYLFKELYVCQKCAEALPIDFINRVNFIWPEPHEQKPHLGWPASKFLRKKYGYI